MLQLLVGHWTRSYHQQNGIVLRVTQLIPSLLQVPNMEATASQDASVVAPNMSTSVADPEPGSQLKQVCPPSVLSEEDASTVFLDIGDVVVKCATDEQFVQRLRSLPPSEKYAYLHHHVSSRIVSPFQPHSPVGVIVASLPAG